MPVSASWMAAVVGLVALVAVVNAQGTMPIQQAQQISQAANKLPITVAPGAAKPGKGISR